MLILQINEVAVCRKDLKVPLWNRSVHYISPLTQYTSHQPGHHLCPNHFTHKTFGCVVFLNMYFQIILILRFYNQLRLSRLAKLPFTLTYVIYVIGAFQGIKKICCVSPLTSVHFFSPKSNPMVVHRRGRDVGSLWQQHRPSVTVTWEKSPAVLILGKSFGMALFIFCFLEMHC